jgi:hypothetical protein
MGLRWDGWIEEIPLKKYREAVKDLSQGSSAARPLEIDNKRNHPEMGGRMPVTAGVSMPHG